MQFLNSKKKNQKLYNRNYINQKNLKMHENFFFLPSLIEIYKVTMAISTNPQR